MTSRSFRTLVWLLAAVVAACSGPAITPTPAAPQPTDPPTALPTASPLPATPGFTPHGPTLPPSPSPGPTLPAGPIADALASDLDRILAEQLALVPHPGPERRDHLPGRQPLDRRRRVRRRDRDLGPHRRRRSWSARSPRRSYRGSHAAGGGRRAVDRRSAVGLRARLPQCRQHHARPPDEPHQRAVRLLQRIPNTTSASSTSPTTTGRRRKILDEFVLEPYFEPGERLQVQQHQLHPARAW